jgi:hypothetical protein
VEAILEEDYEPQTVYLREVTIMGRSAGVTELSGIAVEFDRVLGSRKLDGSADPLEDG